METTTRKQLFEHRKDRLIKKIHGRNPRMKRDPSKFRVEKKTTFRVKARDIKKQTLVFFKTRTKDPQATVKRFATLQGFIPDRIKV